ncbi:hypothetical protein JOM56_009716 [Amanita muscaria]
MGQLSWGLNLTLWAMAFFSTGISSEAGFCPICMGSVRQSGEVIYTKLSRSHVSVVFLCLFPFLPPMFHLRGVFRMVNLKCRRATHHFVLMQVSGVERLHATERVGRLSVAELPHECHIRGRWNDQYH